MDRRRRFAKQTNPVGLTGPVLAIILAMSQTQWTDIDRYLTDHLLPPDPVLEAVVAASEAAGLPSIQVAPNQGKLLSLLAQVQGARNILELGTLGGYSTIWLARALPADGRLITLEANPAHAKVAQANLERAGVADRVEVRVGRAQELLLQLAAEGADPFDFVFIDADKPSIPEYFTWALAHTRRGGLIIVDNVIRHGAIIEADRTDPDVQGVRQFVEMLASESRVSATAIQTVGSKGYDGFALARVV